MRFPLGFGIVCWLGLLLGIAKKVLIGGSSLDMDPKAVRGLGSQEVLTILVDP